MNEKDIIEDDYYTERVKNTSNNFTDFLIQVGRTYLGKPITKDEYNLIINKIINNLGISKDDDVLDLGCGNGLITNDIAKYANHISGFDLTKDLLGVAIKNHQRYNIDYIHSSILDIDFTQYKATKFYMSGVIQSIDYKMFREFLQRISNDKKSFTLFVSDILDQTKILNYYNTEERRDFFFIELIENKKAYLGTWWYKEHILLICKDLGLTVNIKEQDPHASTAHYRFDAVISK